MNELWNVSSSPHVRGFIGTQNLMFDVALALMPAAAFGVYRFGPYALCVLLVAVGFALLTEYTYEVCVEKENTLWDGSALVTGLLLGMNLPPLVPLWIPMLGSIFAILVVKQLFGGIGTECGKSGYGGPVLSADFICGADESLFRNGRDLWGNTSGILEKWRYCGSGSHVYGIYSRDRLARFLPLLFWQAVFIF